MTYSENPLTALFLLILFFVIFAIAAVINEKEEKRKLEIKTRLEKEKAYEEYLKGISTQWQLLGLNQRLEKFNSNNF